MLSMSPQFNEIFAVYTDVSILVMWRRHSIQFNLFSFLAHALVKLLTHIS